MNLRSFYRQAGHSCFFCFFAFFSLLTDTSAMSSTAAVICWLDKALRVTWLLLVRDEGLGCFFKNWELTGGRGLSVETVLFVPFIQANYHMSQYCKLWVSRLLKYQFRIIGTEYYVLAVVIAMFQRFLFTHTFSWSEGALFRQMPSGWKRRPLAWPRGNPGLAGGGGGTFFLVPCSIPHPTPSVFEGCFTDCKFTRNTHGWLLLFNSPSLNTVFTKMKQTKVYWISHCSIPDPCVPHQQTHQWEGCFPRGCKLD